MERWNGRVALVTGATSGIGASMAVTLAKKGLKVVGCGRRTERITELNKQHGVSIIAYKVDLNKAKEIREMFDWIKTQKNLGHVDVCVCNAGFSASQSLMEGDPESWTQMLNVNVTAASLATQLSIQQFKEFNVDDGQIVYVNSVYSHRHPDQGHEIINFYSATKIMNNHLLEMWRKEIMIMKPATNIKISGICPGAVETEFISTMQKDKTQEEFQNVAESFKKQVNFLTPNNVTDALLYILSSPVNVQISDVIIRPTGMSI